MKLYIRNTKRKAEHTGSTLELDPEEWMFMGIGDPLVGHRFNKIVFDVNFGRMSRKQLELYLNWRKIVKTKLIPTGQIITL